MASSRLPGKVMKKVLGRPLLSYLVERLQSSTRIRNIILATTVNSEDDAVATFGQEVGLHVFRGSEHNVLNRFYSAAKTFDAQHIIRITADCPLIDPDLIDELIGYYFDKKFDYVSNCTNPTLPDGLDAEVFSFMALEDAHENAVLSSHLEHVTPYIHSHPDRFNIGNWYYYKDFSHLRWTVDEPEDFEFVRQVIEALYPACKDFRTEDILDLLYKKPELARINAHIARNEGLIKSLEEDTK